MLNLIIYLTSKKNSNDANGSINGTDIEKNNVKINSETAIAFLNPIS